MFPIKQELAKALKMSEIDNYRHFENDIQKSKYIDLLDKEMNIINQMDLGVKAMKLYDLKINYPDNHISKRCFDYKVLEAKCMQYDDVNE